MPPGLPRLVVLVRGGCSPFPAPGRARFHTTTRRRPPQRPQLAVAQVAAVNLFVNRLDAWVLRAAWAIGAGTASWWRNIRFGRVWDEDQFGTDDFSHPFHGTRSAGRRWRELATLPLDPIATMYVFAIGLTVR